VYRIGNGVGRRLVLCSERVLQWTSRGAQLPPAICACCNIL